MSYFQQSTTDINRRCLIGQVYCDHDQCFNQWMLTLDPITAAHRRANREAAQEEALLRLEEDKMDQQLLGDEEEEDDLEFEPMLPQLPAGCCNCQVLWQCNCPAVPAPATPPAIKHNKVPGAPLKKREMKLKRVRRNLLNYYIGSKAEPIDLSMEGYTRSGFKKPTKMVIYLC